MRNNLNILSRFWHNTRSEHSVNLTQSLCNRQCIKIMPLLLSLKMKWQSYYKTLRQEPDAIVTFVLLIENHKYNPQPNFYFFTALLA